MALENGLKASEVTVGMKVTMSDIPGTVVKVCEWSRHGEEVMVEVRMPGGTGCYSSRDLLPA